MAGELMLINPRRRRHRRRRMSALQKSYFGGGRARRNPRRHRRHRRRHVMRLRRNPSLRGITGNLSSLAMPALVGAGGAVAVDAAFGYFGAQLPPSLTTGAMAPITRIAAALIVGWGIGKVAGARNGQIATAGALTVVAYGIVRNFMLTNVPQVPLGRYVGVRRLGRYVGNRGLGYAGPGTVVGTAGGTMRRVVNF